MTATATDDITPIADRWAGDEDDPGYLIVDESAEAFED